MVAGQPPITTDITSLDTAQSNIWKKLAIIKTEAWFDTVSNIAEEHQLRAKLENRYMKSAIICDTKGQRIGRIWHLNETMSIFWDIKKWISHYEAANTVSEAVGKIAAAYLIPIEKFNR